MLTVWLLTNTCYGTWLPGDKRGFVGRVKEHRANDPAGARVAHDQPRTPYDAAMPSLYQAAAELMKNPPVYLDKHLAELLVVQFLETATHRGWQLHAIAVMSNHFHIVVGAAAKTNPSKILGDFKSWGSRTLSRALGTQSERKWWTQSGSK